MTRSGTVQRYDSTLYLNNAVAAQITQENQITEQNMTFHYEGEIVNGSSERQNPIPTSILASITENNNHDITDFLARPILLGSGNIDTTLATGAKIQTILLPNDFLLHSTIKEKVRGFKYFKGDAQIKIVLNGTRFQQGRLITTFFPNSKAANTKYYEATRKIGYITQLPRLEMDINTDDQLSMSIPWVNNRLAFNMISGDGNHGRVDTFIYSPLVVPTGDNTCEYSIYVSYTNVHLSMPVQPSGFIAQAIVENSRRGRKAPTTEEEEDEKPISSSLKLFARGASVLNKIPLLSTVAGPTSWFLNLASNTASAWGFSKPIEMARPTVMFQRPMGKAVNTSGPDGSVNMGCLENNSVSLLPGSKGSNMDELSFANIITRFAVYDFISWTDLQGAGVQLITYPLQPTRFNRVDDSVTINGKSYLSRGPLPCAYVAGFFQQWRGGFKIKLKFVKTEFHSGRLSITFNPDSTAVAAGTFDQQNYNYREIIDLRFTKECEFAVPYVAGSPYLDISQSIGNVSLVVLNQLRAPANVSSNISIIVEVAMTHDTEFAIPRSSTFFPILSTNTPPTVYASSANWTPQAIVETGQISNSLEEKEIAPALATTTVNNLNTTQVAQYCVGEVIQSFRQLMKRHTPFVNFFNVSETGVFDMYIRPMQTILPYDGQTGTTPNDVYYDYFNLISSMFVYMSGSMRIKAYSPNGVLSNDTLRCIYQPRDISIFTPTTLANTNDDYARFNQPLSPAVFPLSTNGTLEVQCPFYFNRFSAIVQQTPFNSGLYDITEAPTSTLIIRSNNASKCSDLVFSRCAGDDLDMGYFVGIPRCVFFPDTMLQQAGTNTYYLW